MIHKKSIRGVVFPLLVSSIFTEVATNHHPDPHGNRSERMEQTTRRFQETMHGNIRVRPQGNGGNTPDPLSEDIFVREARTRRNGNEPSI